MAKVTCGIKKFWKFRILASIVWDVLRKMKACWFANSKPPHYFLSNLTTTSALRTSLPVRIQLYGLFKINSPPIEAPSPSFFTAQVSSDYPKVPSLQTIQHTYLHKFSGCSHLFIMSDIFELLPPELIYPILEENGPEDLLELISASPYCFRVFATNPKRFHLASLKSAVPKPIWSEFTAACFASYRFRVIESKVNFNNLSTVSETQISADRGEIWNFLRQYFGNSSDAEFPIIYNDDMRYARRICSIASFFVKKFTQKALKEAQYLARDHVNHDEGDEMKSDEVKKEPNTIFHLSDAETLRLYRAIFRFQICCRVFRPKRFLDLVGDHRAFEQHTLFIHRFEPWEVEEMTCIHQFLSDAVLKALEAMDCEVESYVREACLFMRPRYHSCDPRDVEIVSDEGPITFVDFSGCALSALFGAFSRFRERRLWVMSSIVSKGLLYMAEFVLSDRDTQFKELRKMHHSVGDQFIVDSLEHLSVAGVTVPRPSNVLYEGRYAVAKGANLASHMYGADLQRSYLRIANENRMVPFRALGYSFWDSERLTSELQKKAFAVAKAMGDSEIKDRYLWHDDDPLELRLANCVIRVEDEAYLVQNFGPLYEDEV